MLVYSIYETSDIWVYASGSDDSQPSDFKDKWCIDYCRISHMLHRFTQ
jgi:hypothetical protein